MFTNAWTYFSNYYTSLLESWIQNPSNLLYKDLTWNLSSWCFMKLLGPTTIIINVSRDFINWFPCDALLESCRPSLWNAAGGRDSVYWLFCAVPLARSMPSQRAGGNQHVETQCIDFPVTSTHLYSPQHSSCRVVAHHVAVPECDDSWPVTCLSMMASELETSLRLIILLMWTGLG